MGGVPVSSGINADAAKKRGGGGNGPTVVRYLSKMHIRCVYLISVIVLNEKNDFFSVEMLNTRLSPSKAGRMFPPVVRVEYDTVDVDDLDNGDEVEFEFSVSYEMNMREAKKDIEVNSFLVWNG